MDKNTLLGLLLMGAVIIGFTWINKPSEEEIAERERQEQAARDALKQQEERQQEAILADTITRAEAQAMPAVIEQYGVKDAEGRKALSTNDVLMTLSPEGGIDGEIQVADKRVSVRDIITRNNTPLTPEQTREAVHKLRDAVNDFGRYRNFAQFLGGESKTVTIETPLMTIDFASRGGQVSRIVLKKYKTETAPKERPITLFTAQTSDYGIEFTAAGRRYNTSRFNFVPERVGDSCVVMRLPMADGSELAFRYTLLPDNYVVRMEVLQKGMDRVLASNITSAVMTWHQKMVRNEKGRTFEERNSALTYKYLSDSPDELSNAKDEEKTIDERLKWVAFKNQFFSSVLINGTSFTSAELNSRVLKDDPTYLKDMTMKATFDYNVRQAAPASFDFYFGPNDYPLLSAIGGSLMPDENLELNRLVPLGWGIFRWINKFIVIPVFSFLGSFITSYGIIILLLTIFIKIILFPLSYKSLRSQARMKMLAPEIKAINEKYPGKDNAMTRQQKTMALYSSAGASPLSGCLPMLLQMPVLIAMFSFFPSAIELRGEAFLWAKDLSAPDTILTLPFTIPFYGNQVSLFCLLMTVVNVVYMRLNMQGQPQQEGMGSMKWMSYLMPIMFLFFFNDYASGLSYYYLLSLLITIIMTYVFRHTVSEQKMRLKMAEAAKKPKKKSGFMARLEEAQRKQQAMLREQQQKGGGKRR